MLSAAQRATFAALSASVLEGAPPSTEPMEAFITRCAERLAWLPAHRQALFVQALQVLESRAAVALGIRQPRRFSQLSPTDRTRCFAAWGVSAIAPLRTAHQAIRKVVMAVYYARAEVTHAIGYAGPLAARAPQAAWEGALPGEQRQDEPVARGAIVLPHVIAPEPPPRGVLRGADVPVDTHRRADVVVIGSGAGGAVTAARLAAAGFEVVILEAGSYATRAEFTEDEGTLNASLYADGALRTTDDGSFSLLQGETAGGSTTVNWMIMLRTPDYVLDEWARHHGVYGMSAAELAPAFDRVEREVKARAVPDDAHSANNRIIFDGARTLGWRASTATINADRCVRCGFCGQGCRHNAKQSTLLTYLPTALANGAMLYTDARVTTIAPLERDTGQGTPPIKRVTARVGVRGDARPRTLVIDAPLVVVAAGAIETPALLQRSAMGGGGVGEWLRLHPTTAITGVYPHDILSNTGIPLSSMCDEFIRWNNSDYGFWIETPPMHPSFMAAALPAFGTSHAARMRQFRQLGVLIALTRDGADTRTSSGRVRVDRHGRTSIQYQLQPADQARVRASVVAAARLHRAAGATAIETLHNVPLRAQTDQEIEALATASVAPNRLAMFSAHVNGTCRMGTDRSRSGATPDGERHGVRGLYISDGALLPTALGVNPQETIMAVASVLADRMATRHAGIPRG